MILAQGKIPEAEHLGQGVVQVIPVRPLVQCHLRIIEMVVTPCRIQAGTAGLFHHTVGQDRFEQARPPRPVALAGRARNDRSSGRVMVGRSIAPTPVQFAKSILRAEPSSDIPRAEFGMSKW